MSDFTIHKFGLAITDEQFVTMPKGARILHVAQQPMQKEPMQLWAHVDKREGTVQRRILMYGTGHPVPGEPGKFLGTVLTHGGAMVWHVYDAGEAAN